ncbi:hypothetical protein GW17_00031507 [Ensete ventricosum]|nr:hypothetical protein GW17_00031507 [Ensete ventricosum]
MSSDYSSLDRPSPSIDTFRYHVGMFSSDSSIIIRVVPIVRSGGISLEHSEASTSGASSGAPSSMDAKALRDLEVMKACHDFDSTVIEGLRAAIQSTIASRRSLRCMLRCTGIDLTTRVLLV